MSMIFNSRRVGDVIILDFAGRFTLGEPTMLIRDLMRDYLENGERKFIFNLAGLTYLDSAGLGAMTASHIIARSQGGNIVLLNLTARVEGLLQMTRLATVFESFKDEAAAVAFLKQGDAAP